MKLYLMTFYAMLKKADETSPEELVKAVGNPQKQFIRKSDNGLFYCEYKTAEGYSVILEFADPTKPLKGIMLRCIPRLYRQRAAEY